MTNDEVKKIIREELGDFFGFDKYTFSKKIKMMDGKNIQLGRGVGTQIGTATDQKLGFFGETPVDQPATITDPAGGETIDAQARTAINALIDRLQELGLIA